MTTILDVARVAGVSSATVSRVLSGRNPVAESTRDRVLAAVEKLDFRLNSLAQGLRRGHSATVALLIGDIEQNHFSATTRSVQEELSSAGYNLLLFNLGHSETRLYDILDRAASMRLHSLIIASSDKFEVQKLRPFITDLQNRGVIVICLGQNLSSLNIPSIVHNERVATRQAVSYLLGKGRKSVAYVGRIDGSAIGTERFRGYKAAISAAGRPVRDELVWDVTFRYSAGRDAVLRAIKHGIRFDAIQAGSDELAFGALSALHDHNVAVPSAVSVVGFGNVVWSEYLRPAITTISSSPDLEAKAVLEVLQTTDRKEAPERLRVIERRLTLRQSA